MTKEDMVLLIIRIVALGHINNGEDIIFGVDIPNNISASRHAQNTVMVSY